jgi:hypothetical protein
MDRIHPNNIESIEIVPTDFALAYSAIARRMAAIGRVQNRIGTIYTCGNQDARRRIRAEFLAIAAELEKKAS